MFPHILGAVVIFSDLEHGGQAVGGNVNFFTSRFLTVFDFKHEGNLNGCLALPY
jgi:hypothetical protein